jgi:hypothetical protein
MVGMAALHDRLALLSVLAVACDADAPQRTRDAESPVEGEPSLDAAVRDAASDADDRDAQAPRDGGERSPADGRDGGPTGDASASNAGATQDSAMRMDSSAAGEAGANDGALPSDDMMLPPIYRPPNDMPWAGQCTPGLDGTVQMRTLCEDQETAAIQAAGIGAAKAYGFAIYSYPLATPMRAGKPFTFSITVEGSERQPVYLEIWGSQSACGAANLERLAALKTLGGIVCATMTPNAAHTHLLLVPRANGNGYSMDVHSECPDGACVMNTGTSEEWPDKNKVFCDPRELSACQVCASDGSCAAPAYTDRGDGTVSSTCCGLTWQKTPDMTSRTWAEAASYCASLTTAGGGFRLPTFAELNSLVKAGPAPTLEKAAFPDTSARGFWSASEDNHIRTHAWLVEFSQGTSSALPKEWEFAVRCVR